MNPELDDIQRIEILKGPQGALYGAAAMGGLVKVVPNAPDLHQFSGSASGGFSGTATGWGRCDREKCVRHVERSAFRHPGRALEVELGMRRSYCMTHHWKMAGYAALAASLAILICTPRPTAAQATAGDFEHVAFDKID